ncbi:MAG TPA: PaaI family thioesterase [Allosphingosinicella sp.]|jgi:uncharacterized protein (TIGR00369 family)
MGETRYGLASREQMAQLSGLELLQGLIEGTAPAPHLARTLGFRLVEVAPGFAAFEGQPSEDFLNPLGTVHGGWALTLIDSAAGCALHSELGPGIGYTTVETKVNFSRPIAPGSGTVRCEGRVVTRGRQIATAEARLTSAEGKILAHGTSTLIILPPR